jgi:hypothetical protein
VRDCCEILKVGNLLFSKTPKEECIGPGIDILDVLLVMEVVNNQCIEFLGAGGGHLEKWLGKWDREGSRGPRGVGGTTEKNNVK